MKNILKFAIVALVLGISTLSANAQVSFSKSDKFVEGTVSYSKSTGADVAYGLKPTFGYFVTDKCAVGLFGEVAKTSAGAETLNYGVFGRCYFLTVGEKFKTFSQLAVSNNTATAAGVETSTLAANLGIGANYFFTSNLALSLNLTDLISYTNSDENSTLTVGFDGVTNPISPVKFGVLYKF